MARPIWQLPPLCVAAITHLPACGHNQPPPSIIGISSGIFDSPRRQADNDLSTASRRGSTQVHTGLSQEPTVPARRSQLVVISDDREVIRACQTVAARTDHLRPARRALQPDRIPPGLGLNDWIVADLDYIGNENGDWQDKIQALAAQIIVTASEERPLGDSSPWLNAGRFLPKTGLEKKLRRMVTGIRDPDRLPESPGAGETTAGPGSDQELVWARQVGEFAQRIARSSAPRSSRPAWSDSPPGSAPGW